MGQITRHTHQHALYAHTSFNQDNFGVQFERGQLMS